MAGRKAMAATSGPGMSRMSEHIGLAIMGEVPVVIVDCQRMGPSTGGATTVSQGDVQFARWGTPGGYPLIVLCPSTVPECYSLTIRAFNLAERFRVPVILLADKEICTTMSTVDVTDYEDVPVERRRLAPPGPFTPYPYAPSASVPPFAPIGGPQIVRFTGSSHDERGHITKNPATVGRLNQHLRAKIRARQGEITLVKTDLEAGAKVLVIAYGITAGSVTEAVRVARGRGLRVSALTIQSLWPVPEAAIVGAMEGIERVVVPELNLGQYRREIERLAGARVVVGINRVDGELIAPEDILEQIAIA